MTFAVHPPCVRVIVPPRLLPVRATLLAAICAGAIACSGGDDASADGGAPRDRGTASAGAAIRPEDPEARAWIAPGEGKVGLAPNWFDSMTDASQFIDRLYAAGAERVVVASESIREERDGFKLADAVRVQLPREAAARARVFAVLDAEARASGRPTPRDTGQAVCEMSWE